MQHQRGMHVHRLIKITNLIAPVDENHQESINLDLQSLNNYVVEVKRYA